MVNHLFERGIHNIINFFKDENSILYKDILYPLGYGMLKYYTLLKNSDLCKKIINFKYLQTKDFRILKAIKHYKVGNNYIEHENVTKLANYILDTYDPSELEELFDINTVCITLYYNLYGKNFRIIIDDVDQIGNFPFYTKEEFEGFSKLGGTKNDILSVSVEYIEREER